jgi:hypothetical protein
MSKDPYPNKANDKWNARFGSRSNQATLVQIIKPPHIKEKKPIRLTLCDLPWLESPGWVLYQALVSLCL